MSDLTIEEIEPYEELKKDKFLDIACDIMDYCHDNCPTILKYGNTNDIIDILSEFINFTNPFILQEDDISSDEEDPDELLLGN